MATATIGSLTFTQIGTSQTCSVTKYGNPSGSIVIPSSVTLNDNLTYLVTNLIGFNDLTYVTHLTIPSSVTSLGDYAFIRSRLLTSITVDANNANYSNDSQGILYNKDKSILIAFPGGLTSITIPNTVTSIASSSFYGSTIQSINIPYSVTSIGEQAFNSCSNLTSVTLNTGLQTIGSFAFQDCIGLTSVTIPDSVTNIEQYAFYGCRGLTSITIPNSVTSIPDNAFLNCSGLTSVTIPNSVTSIGSAAFLNCSGLTSVTIPNSVTNIGNSAFVYCSGLTSVTIGTGVTSISNNAFYGVPSSIKMYFLGSTIPTLTSIFGIEMDMDGMDY